MITSLDSVWSNFDALRVFDYSSQGAMIPIEAPSHEMVSKWSDHTRETKMLLRFAKVYDVPIPRAGIQVCECKPG